MSFRGDGCRETADRSAAGAENCLPDPALSDAFQQRAHIVRQAPDVGLFLHSGSASEHDNVANHLGFVAEALDCGNLIGTSACTRISPAPTPVRPKVRLRHHPAGVISSTTASEREERPVASSV